MEWEKTLPKKLKPGEAAELLLTVARDAAETIQSNFTNPYAIWVPTLLFETGDHRVKMATLAGDAPVVRAADMAPVINKCLVQNGAVGAVLIHEAIVTVDNASGEAAEFLSFTHVLRDRVRRELRRIYRDNVTPPWLDPEITAADDLDVGGQLVDAMRLGIDGATL